MASIRQQQVGSTIQRHLADIFIKEGRNIYGNAFVTITNTTVTPDLSIARIYVSVYNVTDKQGIVEVINENRYAIRGLLGRRIRNKVRKIPSLEFYIDETLDEVFRMEQVFKKLNNEEK